MTISRWPAAILVLLLHLLAISGILLLDRTRPAAMMALRSLEWIKVTDPDRAPPPLHTRPLQLLASPLTPQRFAPPDIAITTRPTGPGAITLPPFQPGQTLDLTIRKPERKTMEELAPSPEKRWREGIAKMAEDDFLARQRELAADPHESCVVNDQAHGTFQDMPRNGIAADGIISSECRGAQSLKGQQMRNDRYSPH